MRWQKLERIAREPGALEILRVCWRDEGFNCGRCEKCLRTMVLLRILGLHSPNSPSLEDRRVISRLTPADRSEAAFVGEALALARTRGDRESVAALAASMRCWEAKRLLRLVDDGFFGGMLVRHYSRPPNA